MEQANSHYQELEDFRRAVSESGQSLSRQQLEIRANKIMNLIKEIQALHKDPTVVDKDAIPEVTREHLNELQQWHTLAAVLANKEQADQGLLIPVQGFTYTGKEKGISSPPTFTMGTNSTLKWPTFKEQMIQYLKLCNFRQKTAVIMLNMSLEANTRAMVGHIKLDTYTSMPDGNGLWSLLDHYQKIFQAGSETGIPLAQFARATQGRLDLHTFHATLRSYYRDAYPDLSSEELNVSSELIQKFIDGLISLKVREHVIRDRHRTWHTYEELLSAALHEQATQVNVNLTTASSQAALQAGMTAAQLIREQEGVFAPKQRPMTGLPQTSQHLPAAEPMEIGAMTGDKCKYCPEKDRPGTKGHTIENCWKIEKAIREYNERQQTRPSAPMQRFPVRRYGSNFAPRPFNTSQGYYQGPRTPFRGNQRSYGSPRPYGSRGRPFRNRITAAILDDCDQGLSPEEAINYHLATLGIHDETPTEENDRSST